MHVRDVQVQDVPAVRQVIIDAFGQSDEADLVEALRRSGDAMIEFLAVSDTRISGHVLLSKLTAPEKCLALAPVSVSPQDQGQGIGGALIDAAVGRARQTGWAAVFVLGEPDYYTRFGFDVSAAAKFETEYPKAYFMALELQSGALDRLSGPVVYGRPFLDLG